MRLRLSKLKIPLSMEETDVDGAIESIRDTHKPLEEPEEMLRVSSKFPAEFRRNQEEIAESPSTHACVEQCVLARYYGVE